MISKYKTLNPKPDTLYPAHGFSLIEAMLYAGLLAVVVLILSELSLSTIKNYRLAKIRESLIVSTDQVLNTFFQETKNARRIYLPTTILDNNLGELSLETSFQNTDETELVTFVDFYWAQGQLWLKRENELAQVLTSPDLEVTQFQIARSVSGNFEGLKLYLSLKSKINPEEIINLSTFVVIRGGYLK